MLRQARAAGLICRSLNAIVRLQRELSEFKPRNNWSLETQRSSDSSFQLVAIPFKSVAVVQNSLSRSAAQPRWLLWWCIADLEVSVPQSARSSSRCAAHWTRGQSAQGVIMQSNHAFERSGHASVLARARRTTHFAPSARCRRHLPVAQRGR